MNTKRLFLTSLLASTLFIGTAAYASPEGGKHFRGNHGGKPTAEMMQKRLDRMAKKLDLSDEQKQQVQALFEIKRNGREAKQVERKALREQMKQLDPTADDYDEKLAEVANTKAAMTREKTIAKGEMRKQMSLILTAEQQEKMKVMRKNKKGSSRSGHGKRCGKKQS